MEVRIILIWRMITGNVSVRSV